MPSLCTLAAGAGWSAVRVARSGLARSAEALGLLTVGLAALDLAGAYRLNLAGLHQVDAGWYSTASAALVAVAFGLVTYRVASGVQMFPVAAALAAVVTPVLALAAADADPVRSAAVSLAAAGCAVTAAALNGSPRRTLWTPARVVTHAAAGTLGVAAAVIAVIATFEEPLAGAGGAAAVIAVAAAAVFRPSFAARSRDKHDRQAGRRRRRCDQRGDWRCGPPGPHPGERSVGSQVSSRWTPDGVGVLTFAGAVAAVADRAQVTGLCVAAGVSAIVAVAVALTRGS